LAPRLWPGESALGKRIHLGRMDPYREDWLTVVGVVAEARPWSAPRGSMPTYYVSHRQRPAFLGLTGIELVIRSESDATTAAVRATLDDLDPAVPVRLSSLDARLSAATAGRRFVLILLGLFAGLALAVCAFGIWGVVAFIASRSTRESGIRLALGARPDQVLRHLQRHTLGPVFAGTLIGLPLAAALIRTVRSLLFGVTAFDPISFAAVALTLLFTAWFASWLPARRVRRLDPADTLRTDGVP
jgi:putative ABC transport system permease protein